ncbi:MAG TPA: carboxy terminal-processing peptidase, partial [Flavobacterium sp.]|nr:carboxy terminal-processing peptidase [Flavobacterium sp.]
SLNLEKFRAEQKVVEETAKRFKAITDYKNALKFRSLPHEEAASAKDVTLKEKRDRWHETLAKDIYIEEAINVLDDLQPKSATGTANLKKKDKLAKF